MIAELEKRSEKIWVDLKSKVPTPNAREEAVNVSLDQFQPARGGAMIKAWKLRL
jgi:hypothetical protein